MKKQPKHNYRIELWNNRGDQYGNRRYYDDYETAKTAYMHYLITQLQGERELYRVELQDARVFNGKWEYSPLHTSTQNYINLLTV